MHQLCRSGKYVALVLALLVLCRGVAVAQIAWVKTFDEALTQAAKEKKSIILDVSASW
jgi:hypothetical protein